MAFVEKLVGPDENLVGVARLHWIYIIRGFLWFFGIAVSGGIIQTIIAMYAPIILGAGNFILGLSIAAGLYMLILYIGKMLFTELGLTTERLIYKRGLIFVDVREVDLEEIKSESIDNGVLGRLLNYGYLDLDARFIEDMDLPAITDPYRFVKAMNAVRSQIKDDNMRVVLDDGGAGAVKASEAIEKHKEERDVKNKKTPRGKKKKTKLEDDQFDTMSSNSAENYEEIKEELVDPEVFKASTSDKEHDTDNKQKNTKNDKAVKFQDNPEQRKKDLSDMVHDDFEEAEEPKKNK